MVKRSIKGKDKRGSVIRGFAAEIVFHVINVSRKLRAGICWQSCQGAVDLLLLT